MFIKEGDIMNDPIGGSFENIEMETPLGDSGDENHGSVTPGLGGVVLGVGKAIVTATVKDMANNIKEGFREEFGLPSKQKKEVIIQQVPVVSIVQPQGQDKSELFGVQPSESIAAQTAPSSQPEQPVSQPVQSSDDAS